jgi:DNA-binding transcriptional MerR regulator
LEVDAAMPRTRRTRAVPNPLDIENVIAAFSEDQVARITGLSKGRLRYWARTDFFKPSFVEENQRLPYSRFYSFKDVVALRTLEFLRVQNAVPLQHLRKVAEKLSHLSISLWAETKLFVMNKEVHFVNPETGKPQAVLTGQLALDLKELIESTRASILEFNKRKSGTEGRMEKHRSVIRNAWVVAGTRIPVAAVQRLHEDGYTAQQIINEYPDLTSSDVEAAIRHRDSEAA